jgi:hypothetical protein
MPHTLLHPPSSLIPVNCKPQRPRRKTPQHNSQVTRSQMVAWLILALAIILTLASATPLNEAEPVSTEVPFVNSTI